MSDLLLREKVAGALHEDRFDGRDVPELLVTIEALAYALVLAVEAADAARGYIPTGSPIGNIIKGHYDLTDASLVELRKKGWLDHD